MDWAESDYCRTCWISAVKAYRDRQNARVAARAPHVNDGRSTHGVPRHLREFRGAVVMALVAVPPSADPAEYLRIFLANLAV